MMKKRMMKKSKRKFLKKEIPSLKSLNPKKNSTNTNPLIPLYLKPSEIDKKEGLMLKI